MRLTSRIINTEQQRSRPSVNFTSLQNQMYFSKLHSSHYYQGQHQPYLINSHHIQLTQPLVPEINKINYVKQLNATTRISTTQVYQSKKEEQKNQKLEDWKILTLKQLKRSKRNSNFEVENGKNKSKAKTYLSITKQQPNEKSKQKNNSLNKINFAEKKEFKCLKSLQKKKNIIDRVQHTIDIPCRSASIFCD